nr:hypothetical protein CFP56_70364 [Quercus suber]
MSMAAVTKVSLKLMIDTERRRVLYAEAGKDFVDFLFYILALPIGTFIPLLNQEMVGSLGNIYDSIANVMLEVSVGIGSDSEAVLEAEAMDELLKL